MDNNLWKTYIRLKNCTLLNVECTLQYVPVRISMMKCNVLHGTNFNMWWCIVYMWWCNLEITNQ